MQRYYNETWHADSTRLAYGSETGGDANDAGLARHGLRAGAYWLVVARLEPENNTELIVRGHLESGLAGPLVVVGNASHESAWSRRLMSHACERVRFVGGVYDAGELNGLYRGCRAYLHGHEVGGTNPSLLRAMRWASPCLALETAFNRETLADTGLFFSKDLAALARLLREVDSDPAALRALGDRAALRARTAYRWEDVAAGYAALFRRLAHREG